MDRNRQAEQLYWKHWHLETLSNSATCLRVLAPKGSSRIPHAFRWQGAPLYCARDAGWVFKRAFYSPSVVRAVYCSAVSNPFAMAVKSHLPMLAVNLALPFKKADKRETAWVFTPALQTCSPAVHACFLCSTTCDPFSPPWFFPTVGRVQTEAIESEVWFRSDARKSDWIPCHSGWRLFKSHSPSLSVFVKMVNFCWQTGFSGWLPFRWMFLLTEGSQGLSGMFVVVWRNPGTWV